MQHETSTKSFLFVFFFKPSLGFCRSEKHFFSLPLLVNASLDDILETGNFRVPILFKSNFAFLILLLLYNIWSNTKLGSSSNPGIFPTNSE